MKYKKILITFVIFLIIISINSISYGAEMPISFFYNENNVVAYTKLNRARLSLGNGQIIADTYATSDASSSISTIVCPLEVILLIDTSGSMQGEKISHAKEAAKLLVNKMCSDPEITDIQIGLVTFNTDATINSSFTIDSNKILSEIDSLSAAGGTCIGKGMEKCQEIFKSRDGIRAEDAKKYLIMLTDGADGDPELAKQKLSELCGDDVNLYTLLIEFDQSNALEEDNPYGNVVYPSVKSSQIENIFYEIFDEIKSEAIEINFEEGKIKEFKWGYVLDNNVHIILDEELKQSCLLELEYSITILNTKNFSYLRLIDHIYDSQLVYSEDSVMMTDPTKKNSDYKWKLVGTDELKNLFTQSGTDYKIESMASDGNYVIDKKGEPFEAKIYLSRLLSTADDGAYGSEALIDLVDDKGNTYTIPLTCSKIFVMPPWGKDNILVYKPIFITLVVMIFSLVAIIILVKKINK